MVSSRASERGSIDEAVAGLTLVDVLERNADRDPDGGALRWKKGDGWETLSWSVYRHVVTEIAAGLIDVGVRVRDAVGIMAGNRPEHLIADLAIIHAGGIPVSFYPTMAPSQLGDVVADCGARVVVVESADMLARLEAAAPPSVETVILLEPDPSSAPGSVGWEEVRARGRRLLGTDPEAVEERSKSVVSSDAATIIYTSGTSGRPKGVVLSHRATVWTNESADRYLRRAAAAQRLPYPRHRRMISYLPLAHIAERQVTHYAALWGGNEVTFCPDPATLPGVLAETRPHFFVGVPRVWEKVKGRIEERLQETPSALRRRIGVAAFALGERVARAEEARTRVPLLLRLRHRLAERLVLRKIREALGLDRVIVALCGAAHVDPDVVWFFRGMGLPLFEAYGLSETTGYGTANGPGASRVGTVGRALPGIELAVDADGEVLLRGGMIADRYLTDPEETAAAFDEDGWLHTGDVGSIDEDGFLTLDGRKKELIITSGGKNVAPAPIERRLEQHPLIGHACVVGDGRPYVTALMTIDWEDTGDWAAQRGLRVGERADFVKHPDVRASVRRWVEDTNAGLSRPEQIKDFVILAAPWTVDRGELTPTLKTVRRVVTQRYAADIDSLYE
jgi:long-chain acyl-CoA synthetase